MSEQQFIFEAEELETVSCDCPKCGTTIMVNVNNIREEFGVPQECPTCHQSSDMADAIMDYRRFFRTAKKLNIRLRTKPVASSGV